MFNKRQRFSIRKLSVGVASVLLGAISVTAMSPVSAQDEPAAGVVEENLVPAAGAEESSVPAAGTAEALVPAAGAEEENNLIGGAATEDKPARDDLGELTIADTFNPNQPVLTEVEDLNDLTPEEREQVALAFMNANPSLASQIVSISVDYNGGLFIKFVDDSEVLLWPGVVQKGTKVETITETTTPQSTVVEGVADLKALTQEEKDAIKESIEAGNPVVPAGLEYGFEEDGELTLFYSEEAMKTIIEAVKKANPNLPERTDIVVDYNGDVIFVYSDGSEDVITIKTVLAAKEKATETTVAETTVAETTVEEVVTETEAPAPVAEQAELPNTGTASSIVSLGAAATSLLLGLGVLKRKED